MPTTPEDGFFPLWARFGRFLLFGVFVSLLAGRFTLNRISTTLPAADLRWVMLGAIVTLGIVWYGGAAAYLPDRHTNPGTPLFVVWAAWMATSTLWAQPDARIAQSLEDQFFLIAFVLMAIVLIGWLPAAVTRSLWKWFFVTGLVYLAAAMISGPGPQGRYSAFMGGPNVFVRIMIIGAVSAVFLALTHHRILPLVSVPAFALGAVLSGSRGGLLAAGAILALALVPLARRLGTRRLIWLLVSLGGTYYVVSRLTNGNLHAIVAERLWEQTVERGYTSGRVTIIDTAWRIFSDHPYIGIGIDGYYAMQQSSTLYQYPHNLALATGAEGGVVGIFFLCLSLWVFASTALNSRPLPPAVLCALMAGGSMLFASMFSGDYYDSRFMWVFFALAALTASERRRALTGVRTQHCQHNLAS